jgi:hypothetical protein
MLNYSFFRIRLLSATNEKMDHILEYFFAEIFAFAKIFAKIFIVMEVFVKICISQEQMRVQLEKITEAAYCFSGEILQKQLDFGDFHENVRKNGNVWKIVAKRESDS